MKNLYLIFLFLFSQIYNNSWDWLAWPTINNNITVNPVITADSNSNPTNTSSNNNNQKFDQKTLQDLMLDFKSELKSTITSELSDSLLNALKNKIKGKFIVDKFSFTKKHLYSILGIISISAYTYYYIKIYNFNKQLEAKNSWGSWKTNLNLEQLLESSKEELKQELLNDAKRLYGNKKETFFTPEDHLKTEIIKEKEELKYYINLIEKLKKIHLSFIFPIKEVNVKLAQERINKLSFMIGIIN